MKFLAKIGAFMCAIAILTGCTDPGASKPEVSGVTHYQSEGGVVDYYISTIHHKGHSYLLYQARAGYAGYGGLTHDPDCPCHNKTTHVQDSI